jgi:hypothetical protein
MPVDGMPQEPTLPASDPSGRLSDDEVREMLARLKQLADEAQIPDEPFTVDIGDTMKQVVDKALAGKE